ncbi:Eco57I restriction-modification methylase domain-containing protein [Aquimarina sp. 2201CG14-23]|uniref:Eco57I restriction-modification methylase domain-containing protein n=1 Tax=Aquimarina mycalae TaxID=3040073 RepID=UPI002477E974|nr:N-6 DNA methylase [Aquimarina sp. 2201CG14-23]MDH7448034.1 N-6 DNA methylase [Aquimarina sp. 2201CG14-23]
MQDKKQIGSYYTPQRLANFIANYCLAQLNSDSISILEPSVGDGVFVEAINQSYHLNNFNEITFDIVEREADELQKAIDKNVINQINLTHHNQDYLNFHSENQNEFSLIIGNPPYVKSNFLSEEQKIISNKIHVDQNLSNKRINNIWTAFLVSAISKIEDDGIVAFVLPLELLQVKFTAEIRELLKQSFVRLEIFMFDELQFLECKGQDTVLLIGYKEHNNHGTYYSTIQTMDDLENNRFVLQQNIAVSESDKKWTHHFITPDEYSFLENIKSELKSVTELVDNKAGIVTAANDFFIVNDETLRRYRLRRYSRPIIRKGFFVNGSVTFNDSDFEDLVVQNKPSYLLDFNLANPKRLNKGVQKYIDEGEIQELHLRYKCKKRKHWYQVPNIVEHGEAFFFKRAHEYPKLLKNEASVHVTDSAYVVKTKEGIDINDFVYSFYNSLTLTFSELEGRYYGGGVLELTPNEFRTLPIPMASADNFNDYTNAFKNKSNIDEVLKKHNQKILNTTLNLSIQEIDKIETIRKKLVNRRQRK